MSNVVPLVPPAARLIPEDQVTLQRLSDILDATYCEAVIEEQGDIYVTEGVEIPLWLRIRTDGKLIVMFTAYDAETEIPVDRINTFNATIILPQFSREGSVLWGRYWLTYDGGLNVRHFIKMLRRFSGAFRTAVEELKQSIACEHSTSPETSPSARD
jgi:hypothetical protein